MKTRKCVISMILVLALAAGSTPAMAAQPEFQGSMDEETLAALSEPKVTERIENGIIVETAEPVDLSKIDPACLYRLEETAPAAAASPFSGSAHANAAPKEYAAPQLTYADIQGAERIDLSEKGMNTFSNQTSEDYDLQSFSSSLEAEQQDRSYILSSVPAGAIVQAELQVPRNLSVDFDLYLGRWDEENQTFLAETGSVIATDSNFMPETVGLINQTGADCDYVIYIVDYKNHTAEDHFTLTVSVGGKADGNEPNENPLYPTFMPNMPRGSSETVFGSIHSPIDNDWLMLNVPDATEVTGLEIDRQNLPENVIVESYLYDMDTYILTKTGSTKTAFVLPVSEGYNFFRIYYDRASSFAPVEAYKIKFSTELKPALAQVLVATDGYCSRTSNQFADRQTRYMILGNAPLEVKVLYFTEDGIPVNVSDRVDVEIDNPAWANPDFRYIRFHGEVEQGSSCSAKATNSGTVLGFDAWYNMVYMTVTSSSFGTLGNRAPFALVYKYNDNYLEKPCQHNGACGFL